MRWVIVFLLLIICTSLCYAKVELKTIYNGEIKDYAELNLDGKNFTINVIGRDVIIPEDCLECDSIAEGTLTEEQIEELRETTKIRIVFPNGVRQVLSYNDSIKEGNYYLYYLDVRQGGSSEFDIAKQRYPFFAAIKILKAEAEIVIEKIIEKTTLYEGEESRINFRIKNEGFAIISEAEFTDSFPEGIRVSECTGCTIENRTAKWSGQIPIGGVLDFRYYIKGLKAQEFDSEAKLKFGSTVKTTKEKITIKKNPLKVNTTMPDKSSLNGIFEYNISLNNLDEEVNVTNMEITFIIPDDLLVDGKTKEIERVKEMYYYSGYINPEETIPLFFRLSGKTMGEHTIKSILTYEYNSKQVKMNFQDTIQIIVPKLKFEVGDITHMQNTYRIPIKIINPSQEQEYKRLKITLDSDLDIVEDGIAIDQILKFQKLDTTGLELSLPEEYKTYNLKLHIVYESINGDIISEDIEKTYDFRKQDWDKETKEKVPEQNASGVVERSVTDSEFDFASFMKYLPLIVGVLILINAVTIYIVFKMRKKRKQRDLEELSKKIYTEEKF